MVGQKGKFMRLCGGAEPPPPSLLVMAGSACNNRCEFCSALGMRSGGDRSTAELAAELSRGRARHSRVEFIGGEFTIRPDAVQLVRLCRRLGYSSVSIESNGRRFSDKAFTLEIVGAGLSRATFSLHAASAPAHDALTCSPGSFRQALAGLRNAVRAGLPAAVNFVVTKLNFREIPAAARLFCSVRGVKNVRFSLVRPVEHFSRARFLRLVPRFSEVVPFVRAALRYRKVSLFSFPPCLVPGRRVEDHREKLSMEKNYGFPAGATDCYSGVANLFRKAPVCGSCSLEAFCPGIWRKYLRWYGEAELQPVWEKRPVQGAKGRLRP